MATGKKSKEKRSRDSKPLDRNDPNLHFGCGEFTLPNGDVYVGDYCAHRSGIIWREGHGIYTTQDGQVYEGLWSDDKLVENKEVLITYPNGVQYQGPLLKNKYHGPGTYVLASKMNISCEFVENKPVGTITLVDCQGKLWKGKAGEDSAVLLPENVFYLTLNDYKGKGVSKGPLEYEAHLGSSSSMKEGEEQEELCDKDWEKIIFARTKMTEDDVDFAHSKWAKNYEEFKQKYDGIKAKIKEGVSLDDEEYAWIEKFKEFKQRRPVKRQRRNLERVKEREEVFKLNEKFRSKDFIESCPGVQVIYPQKHHNLRHSHLRTPMEMDMCSDDDIVVNDKTNIIYVNSDGDIVPPPPSEVGVASDSNTQSSTVSQEDVTVKFNELVQCSSEFKRLASHFSGQRTPPTEPQAGEKHPVESEVPEPWDGTMHFSDFRDELYRDAKIEVAREKRYQEEKSRKAQEYGELSKKKEERSTSRIQDKVGSAETLKKKEKKDKHASSTSIGKEQTERKSYVTVANTASDMKRSKLEGKVRRCVEQFLAGRKMSRLAGSYAEERVEKRHLHSVVAHTESLTGIPRELLLKK